MNDRVTANRRFKGPRAAMAVTLPGLLACLVAFALLPHDRLFAPLTILLAACTVFASVAWVDLDDRLLIDASFVPSVLAMGFLGPAAAFAIVVVGELGSWCVRRYRAVGVPINLVALGAPALGGAGLVDALQPRGATFYVTLGVVSFVALALNDLILTTLVGILDDAVILERLKGHVSLVPAISINLLLGLATASLYAAEGASAIAIVLLAILAFNYMATQMLKAKGRARQIEELAASRQRLVIQALNAEDRERRRLSERLHDEAIQDLLIARQDLAEASNGRLEGVVRAEVALGSALQELRATVFDLHPAALDHTGLSSALGAVAEKQGRLGDFQPRVTIDPQLAATNDRLLFTAGRELLTNVARHAAASVAELRIGEDGDRIVLEVWDDGKGFGDDDFKLAVGAGHIGLASLSERVEAVDGSLDIASTLGKGTRVRATLPPEAVTAP